MKQRYSQSYIFASRYREYDRNLVMISVLYGDRPTAHLYRLATIRRETIPSPLMVSGGDGRG